MASQALVLSRSHSYLVTFLQVNLNPVVHRMRMLRQHRMETPWCASMEARGQSKGRMASQLPVLARSQEHNCMVVAFLQTDLSPAVHRMRMLRHPKFQTQRCPRCLARTRGQPGRGRGAQHPRRQLCTGGRTLRQPLGRQCRILMHGRGRMVSAIATASALGKPQSRAGEPYW